MTYEEIKQRLTKCELQLKEFQDSTHPARKAKNFDTTVKKLTVLKESLQKQLKEAEETMLVKTKGGDTAVVGMDRKAAQNLKTDPSVTSIKTSKGQKIKEQEGVAFSKEETTVIAKEVGKAVAKALHSVGDEVAHMKARNIEENSFEIYVQYKNDSDDQFSFYISDDSLHLVDFSFDKELVDVGVKPSGEAIVHVDVLANELVKHFKSLANEGMSDQEFADAEEADRLEKHPEKDTIKKIQALIAAQQKKEETEPEVEDLYQHDDEYLDQLKRKKVGESIFDTPRMGGFHSSKGVAGHMNTYSQDKAYADSNRKAREKDDETIDEAPEGTYYIKVAVRDARKALELIDDSPAYSKAVEMDGSDTYYLTDEQLAHDLLMDLGAHGIEVTDNNIDLDEASDYAKRRAAERDYQPAKKDAPAKKFKEPKNDYFARRKKELDYKYGSAGQEMYEGEEQYTVAGRPVKLHKGESSDGTDWTVEFENGKTVELSSVLALIKPFPQGITAEGDVDAQVDGGDLDVGHQDDEPDMLKQQVYDIATYAAKLYKILDKYDQYDGEVDFPHWWQKKVILARDYISAAQHYLEFEEKQPAIDALALEENTQKASYNKLKKEYDALVGKMKQLAVHFKTAEGESKAKIVAALKQHTARKRELESLIDKTVGGVGIGQELDPNLSEAKATCCGKCGRVHVKGSECKRPFLKGKDHCRYN